jgi:hypothetical protein
MLNKNIDSIIYQGYVKLGDIAYKIAVNSKAGLEGTKHQKQLWDKAIIIFSYLETISKHIEVVNGSIYRIINIEVKEMNKLLSCLVEVAKIYDYPVAPFIPVLSTEQIIIGAGLPGNPGADGTSAYILVRFASSNTGTNFSATPDISRPYVAFRTSTSPIPNIPSSFTGLWVRYFGEDGTDGIDGINGTDGKTILSGAINPSTEGVDGDFYINTTTWVIFGPKDVGVWPLGTPIVGAAGADGTNGLNGKTVLTGAGSPSNELGTNGDFYIDNTSWTIFGPKDNDQWGVGTSIIGPPGADGNDGNPGTDGINGESSTIYMAWADDFVGNGFTQTFNQNKDYIAFLIDAPGLTKDQSDFDGLWKKYGGDGDRWSTTSTTSLTIGIGIRNLIVGLNLAYSTGQRAVIAVNNDEDNRMEGYVRAYDSLTGQMSIDVDTTDGAGTHNIWDVNLVGVPVQVITTDSYFGEIYIEENTAGIAQILSGSFTKVNQFNTNGDFSPGVIISNVTNNIIPTVRGAYYIYFEGSISSNTAGAEILFQLFKNGVAIPGTLTRVIFENDTDLLYIGIKTIKSLNGNDELDVRTKADTGAPFLLLEEGRFGVFTTGSPSTPDFTTFENIDLDTGTEDVDVFDASLAHGVEWDVVIRKGINRKRAKIGATWEGININWDQFNTIELGTIDVTFDVDINGGNVRLRGIATSDDWIVSGNRTLIK